MSNNPEENNQHVEPAKGYQAYYRDNSNGLSNMIISEEFKDLYQEEFNGVVPNKQKFLDWKQKNGIKEIAKNNMEQAAEREGYKFTSEARKILYDYLNKRPMKEVEEFMVHMFEIPNNPDPYYTLDAVQGLTKYLQETCPRIEIKPIIEMMANGGLEKYVITPKKPEEV